MKAWHWINSIQFHRRRGRFHFWRKQCYSVHDTKVDETGWNRMQPWNSPSRERKKHEQTNQFAVYSNEQPIRIGGMQRKTQSCRRWIFRQTTKFPIETKWVESNSKQCDVEWLIHWSVCRLSLNHHPKNSSNPCHEQRDKTRKKNGDRRVAKRNRHSNQLYPFWKKLSCAPMFRLQMIRSDGQWRWYDEFFMIMPSVSVAFSIVKCFGFFNVALVAFVVVVVGECVNVRV